MERDILLLTLFTELDSISGLMNFSQFKFVYGVKKYFINNRTVTEKQLEVLSKILEEIKGVLSIELPTDNYIVKVYEDSTLQLEKGMILILHKN